MKKEKLKNNHGIYFVIYTVVFWTMSCILFYEFWKNKISFVWKVDGWSQHIHALQFYSNWLQEIIKTLFSRHKLEVPLWSFSVGYGSDIITTLHYYVIGDPLCLLSVFVPDKYMVHFYDIMILFRIYLAGITFSIYCFYRKHENKFAIITGAILYSFSTYILVMGFHHPFFINPLIYFPLLLTGIEMILKKDSPLFFIIIVFICTISNFYFMYMIAFNAAIYLFIRLFKLYEIKNVGELIKKIGCMIMYAVIGVMMGACILVSVLNLFMENSRTSTGQEFRLLYEKEFYQKIPKMLLAPTSGTHHTMLALCCVILFCVYLLFLDRKNTDLKIMLGLLTVLLLTPAAGKIFNGFSYPSNRWMFSYIFLLSYIVVISWNNLFKIRWKDLAGIGFILIVILLYNYYNLGGKLEENTRQYIIILGIGLLALGLNIVLSKNKFSNNKMYFYIIQTTIFLLAPLTVQLNVKSIFYSPNSGDSEFIQMEQVKKDLKSSADKAILKVEHNDKNFFRYDANVELVQRNSTLQSCLNSTNFYWSLSGRLPAKFFEEIALINKGAYNYKNLDGRTILNEIVSTKYYVTTTKKNEKYTVPFGYKKISDCKINTIRGVKKRTVFENEYALPLGYTYDSYYTRKEYGKMNEIERQNALIQGVLLEKEQSNCPKTEILQNYSEIPYKIVQYNGVKQKGHVFDVEKSGANITLETKQKINDSEMNLLIKNIVAPKSTNIADDNSKNARYEVIIQNSNGEKIKKTFFYFQLGNIYYTGRNHFLVNLSYYKEGKQTIIIKFPIAGKYRIGSLKIYAQSMDHYPEQVLKLKEDILENVKVQANAIRGDISLKQKKILCLSIPYSKGWTAYVDGKKQEILQANTMFMALPLSEGTHSIVLRYCTPGLKAGIAISCVGLALCIIICIQEKKNKSK